MADTRWRDGETDLPGASERGDLMLDALRSSEKKATDTTGPGLRAGKPDFAPNIGTDDEKWDEDHPRVQKLLGLSRKHRRRLFYGLGSGGLVGMAFWSFSLFAQPLQLVHFAETLKGFHFEHLEDLGDYKRFRRLKYLGDPDKVIKRRAGFGGKFIVEQMDVQWEKNGIKINRNANGRAVSFKVDNQGAVDAFKAAGYDLSPGDTIQAEDGMFSNKKNRKLIRRLAFNSGMHATNAAILSRVTIRLHGLGFRVFGNIGNKTADYARDRGLRWRQNDYEPRIKKQSGADFDARKRGEFDDLNEGDSDAELRSKVLSKIGTGAGAATILCAIKDIGGLAVVEDIKSTFNASIAHSQTLIAGASQYQTGDYIIEDLEELSRGFYGTGDTVDSAGTTVASSAVSGLKSGLENFAAPGISTDDDGKTGIEEALWVRTGVGNDIPGIPIKDEYTLNGQSNKVDDTISSIDDYTGGNLSRVCSAVKSTIAQVALTIFGGPLELLLDGALAIWGDDLAALAVNALRGNEVPANLCCSQLGGVSYQGGKFLSNTVAATGYGGVELSPDQEREVVGVAQESANAEFQSRDFYSRYFDVNSHKSFASNLIAKVPPSLIEPTRQGLVSNLGNSIASIFKSPLMIFSDNRRVEAFAGDIVDVGTEAISEPPEMIDDPEFYPDDKFPTDPIKVWIETLDAKVLEKVEEQKDLFRQLNPGVEPTVSPFLSGQTALEVINNNSDPTREGMLKTGDYDKSISAVCFNWMGYDIEDFYAGDTLWVQRDDREYLALSIDGISNEELGARPDACNTGVGIPPVVIKTDPEHSDGAPYDIHTVTIEITPDDWKYHLFYYGWTRMTSAEVCFLADIPDDGKPADPKAERICEREFDITDELRTTQEIIDEFAEPWKKIDVVIDDAAILGADFPLGDSGAILGDTSDVACAAGNDAGTTRGSAGGNVGAYEIRLCDFGNGIVVNSTISGSIAELVAAAQADGVSLYAVDAFRTVEEQQYFWDCYQSGLAGNPFPCNNGNLAARPGTSNHEIGFALDFSPSSIVWLEDNLEFVHSLGFSAQVAGEDWHFSTNGR